MFQCFHVFLEVGNSCSRLNHRVMYGARRLLEAAVEFPVIYQRAYGSFTLVDLGGYRLQARCRESGVLDSLLAALETPFTFLSKSAISRAVDWRAYRHSGRQESRQNQTRLRDTGYPTFLRSRLWLRNLA